MALQGVSAAQLRVAGAKQAIEPGVSGKEKVFQQSRQFGPGPVKPFPYSKPPVPSTRVPKARSTGPAERDAKSRGEQSSSRGYSGVWAGGSRGVNDGVYRGGNRMGTKRTGLLNRGERRA